MRDIGQQFTVSISMWEGQSRKTSPPQREGEEGVSIGSGPETQIDSFGSPSRTSSLSFGLSPFAHNFALDRTR
jgi:hypothetical protein